MVVDMRFDKHPIEIANLAEVEKAISDCVAKGRALGLSMLLGLHSMLMEGVPEEPGHPLKPGRFRDMTDRVEAGGVEHLTAHMAPAWKIESDIVSLLEDVERGELVSEGIHAAGRFHYRFVRIHPFCDGNGRMARALSNFLLAREHPEVLNFERPVSRIILEHREDYISVLEYCDGIYEDLREENMPEEEKIKLAERPFSGFHATAFLRAYRDHNEKMLENLRAMGVSVQSPELTPSVYDLTLEHIKAVHPWNENLKKGLVSLYQRRG